MDDNQLLRYSRHILLPQLGVEGQEKLLAAHALIIGAGGLGSPIALYLAAAGVGHITICDGDTVDLTNLQRQIAHFTHSLGSNKALSAQRTLAAINPEIRVTAIPHRIAGDELAQLVAQADVVLDASDNFATRHAINLRLRQASQTAGFRRRDSLRRTGDGVRPAPCRTAPVTTACSRKARSEEGERCAVMGVFAPLVGIIGAVQAAEALKLLGGIGQSLTGKLQLLDGLSMEWRQINLKKDPACPVCHPSRIFA